MTEAMIAATEAVSPMCAAALVYAERRWQVFPAQSSGKKKSHKAAEFSNGERWGTTTDPAEIRRDFRKWPRANIGIATGQKSGIFVVEADTPEGHDVDGIASLRELEAKHGALPETLMAESPSGSPHYYFKWPPNVIIRNHSSKIGLGIDQLGEGGMVIAPPSVRPGEGVYRWLNAAPIADAPQWLIDLATADDGDEERTPNDEPEADPDKIAAAFAIIPNNDAGFDVLNDLGMAAWRATRGSEAGFQPWAGWCAKSPKFGHLTAERRKQWRDYSKYPPNRIGAGTIFYHADQAQPGWSEQYDNAAMDKATQESLAGVDAFIAGLHGEKPPIEESSAEPLQDVIAPGADQKSQSPGAIVIEPLPPAKVQRAPAPPTSTASSGLMPVDLWASFPPPELPADLLPKVIENYARAEAKTMGADVAGIAMGALAVCAAAISDSIQLQVKKHSEHWKESARIWVALIGDPSSKKTPILRQVARPLARIDAQLYRKYSADKAYHDNLPAEEKKKANPPKQRRVRIEDTTIEAAQEVLKDSPDGVLCLQDELSGWFGGMDKYSGKGAAKDRGFWLQSFNGGEYVFNRVSRGSIIIENLSVSMLGGIQPDPMRKLAADSVDDGLLQRLRPIILRASTMGRDEPDDGAWKHYGDLVDGLHMMRAPNFVLRFDNDAQAIRQQLEQKHLDLMNCEAVNKKLSAHLGKYDGIFARLCVLWHCIETVGNDRLTGLSPTVTAKTAQRVADFMHTFLLPHALSFYAGVLGLSDDHDRLSAIAGYILARGLGRITNRHIQHGDRTMRKMTKKDTDVIFEQLEAFGWVARREGKKPSSLPVWEVNPMVHQLFAERAAQEASRRLSVREAIAEALGRKATEQLTMASKKVRWRIEQDAWLERRREEEKAKRAAAKASNPSAKPQRPGGHRPHLSAVSLARGGHPGGHRPKVSAVSLRVRGRNKNGQGNKKN